MSKRSTSARKTPSVPNCIVQFEGTNTENFTSVIVGLYSMKPNSIITMMTTKELEMTSPYNRIKKIAANKGCDQKFEIRLRAGGMIRISLESDDDMKYHAQYHLRAREEKHAHLDTGELESITYHFEMIRDESGLISCIIEGEILAETREAPNDIPSGSLFS